MKNYLISFKISQMCVKERIPNKNLVQVAITKNKQIGVNSDYFQVK